MNTLYITTFVASFFLSMLFIFVFRPFALWINWVDKPNARKLHQSSVPVIGGLGVFLAVALALALSPQLELASEEAQYLLVGSGLLLLLGLADDRLGLSAMPKLTVELSI